MPDHRFISSLTVSALLAACGGGSHPGADAGTSPDAGGPGTGQIPAWLLDIEGTAEDAFDVALTGDAAAFAADAVTVEDAWEGGRPTAVEDGAPAAVLDDMDAAVTGLIAVASDSDDVVVRGRAANAISAPMDELFALYQPPVPPALLALDYLGREVVLDGMAAEMSAADADIGVIDSTWGDLRPEVVAAGGSSEASDYDASIEQLRAAVMAEDAAALIESANVGLELVDAIEALFEP